MSAQRCDPVQRLLRQMLPPNERGCRVFTGWRDREGYGRFWLDGRNIPATHAALMFLGGVAKPSDKHEAAHHCDNPGCLEPTHLRWALHIDNIGDRERRGRRTKLPMPISRGSKNGNSKLTEDAVRRIRANCPRKTARQWGIENGVSTATIKSIRGGKIWRHVA